MKKVSIICFTDYTKEPRVLRTINALKDDYQLSIFSTSIQINGIHKAVEVINLNKDFYFQTNGNVLFRKLKTVFVKYVLGYKVGSDKYFNRQYWSTERHQLLKLLQNENADVYIGHGIYTLPLLAKLSRQAKVVFNAHEYYPCEFEENLHWVKFFKPYYMWILNKYYSSINLTFAVTSSIGKRLSNEFKIKYIEINNASEFKNLQPARCDDLIKIIHHGAALKGRKIEEMCNLMTLLPENYELNLMLVKSDEEYFNKLLLKYKSQKNIKFLNPVSFSEIPNFINQFDIGLYILKPNNFNEEHCLPNKFFEFIQARLCLAISPNTDMKEIVEKYNLGVVSSDFSSLSMKDSFLSLSIEKIQSFKETVHKNAELLCAENNYKIIKNSINELLKN